MTPAARPAPLWFIAVGSAAAAVHFAVVVGLVERLGWAPLVANVAGWAVAFGVSFSGHLRLTFRALEPDPRRAAWRFFVLSASGFAVNEAAYALLLGLSPLGYAVALAAVLVGVAVGTWLLSRHWAFAHSAARPR